MLGCKSISQNRSTQRMKTYKRYPLHRVGISVPNLVPRANLTLEIKKSEIYGESILALAKASENRFMRCSMTVSKNYGLSFGSKHRRRRYSENTVFFKL